MFQQTVMSLTTSAKRDNYFNSFNYHLVNYFSLASFMAAWAAARRATGTRNGEQLT